MITFSNIPKMDASLKYHKLPRYKLDFNDIKSD